MNRTQTDPFEMLTREGPIANDYGLRPPKRDREQGAAVVKAINEGLARPFENSVVQLFEAPWLSDDAEFEHQQLRSEPLPAMGNGELRFDVPPKILYRAEFVEDVLYAVRWMNACSPTVSRSVADIWRIAQAAVARHRCIEVPVRIVTVGVRATSTLLACFDGTVELEILGHGLAPVIARVDGCGHGDLEDKIIALLNVHLRRAEQLSLLRNSGHRGLIEDPARRVLILSGMSMDVALVHLQQRNLLEFEYFLPAGAVVAHLFWRDGVLKTNFVNYGVRGATL